MTDSEHGKANTGEHIHFMGETRDISRIPWTEHPAFEGVFMKHLIVGAQTLGRFSSHLVRIDPGCSLGEHCHDEHMELHEIKTGGGRAHLDKAEFDCVPGDVTLIPKGTSHSLQAAETGMTLYAKFFPALA